MTRISKITLLTLLATALVVLPASIRAQDTTAPKPGASDQTAPKNKKHGAPFHGKVAAIDAKAGTFTVGTLVIHVGADTKITKDNQPAALADLKVGEQVGGAYVKADDGQLNAAVVHIGAKAEGKPEPKAHDAPASSEQK